MKTTHPTAFVCLVLLVSNFGSTLAGAATRTVSVSNFEFTPPALTVKVGDTVTFNNASGAHTVTGTGAEPFCGPNQISGSSCKVTFTTPGVFPYRCRFHSSEGPSPSGMVGTVTVEAAESPNLVPFQVAGWSDKLVLSTIRGSHQGEDQYFDDQHIFVDWAIVNASTTTAVPAPPRFFTELLVDGVSKSSWFHDGLAPNTFNSVEDFDAGQLPAGRHTFKITTDHTGVVDESNETDNSYELTITVLHRDHREWTVIVTDFEFSPSSLTVTAGDTVTFSNINGSHTVTGTGADPFCGDGEVRGSSCKITFDTPGVFPYRCRFHSSAGPTPSGMVGSITVVAADKPNLVPFQIQGWSDKIVASTAKGSHAGELNFFDDQNVFVDWAIANVSKSVGIGVQFFTELILDGSSKASWSHDGLVPDTFNFIEDFDIGTLPAGQHTLRITTDHTGVVDESEEADNSYEITINVTGRSGPSNHTVLVTDFEFSPSSLSVKVGDTVTFNNINGTHTVTGTGADPFCGPNQISGSSCKVTFNTPGAFPYRCLFHSSDGVPPAGMAGSILVFSTIAVEGSSKVEGPYSTLPAAITDFARHTVSVPVPAGSTFWRLRSEVALRISAIDIRESKIVLTYE